MLLSQLVVPRSWKASAREKAIGTKISKMRSPLSLRHIKSKLKVKENKAVVKMMTKSASLINITELQVRFNTDSSLFIIYIIFSQDLINYNHAYFLYFSFFT